jgi:PHD/YefM family antitoxin component YafN of YafNO toxin-antitoxin module
MRRFSSTQAKQSFGDLLRAAQDGPVAIERHRKVQAIVASPDRFAELDAPEARRSARRLARAQQDLVERDRLIRHQQLAIELLTQSASERSAPDPPRPRSGRPVARAWPLQRGLHRSVVAPAGASAA